MLKRALDIVVSIVTLVVLSPALVTVAVAVHLDSPGPVLFRAKRVGRGGQEFWLYKFRSMFADADRSGPGITTAGDKRITRVGRVLRRTKLDELPQLFNVLRGEMSLVGPRPEDPRYVALYTPEQRAVLAMRPGITSLASIRYRHEERMLDGDSWEERYIQQVMPEKLAIDLEYMRQASVWQDLAIIARTVLALWR